MPGTPEGGRKAAATNKLRYGADFYEVNGRKGGLAGDPKKKGFAKMSKERISEIGRMGGKSGRGVSKVERKKSWWQL